MLYHTTETGVQYLKTLKSTTVLIYDYKPVTRIIKKLKIKSKSSVFTFKQWTYITYCNSKPHTY